MLKRLERAYWRRRATAMDRVYVRLEDDGLTTARHLAAELNMNPDYVSELLEDLHLDAIVGRAGELYYVVHEEFVRVH